jgi:CheY-like chemotaxis protein
MTDEPTILIVDDNADLLDTFARILKRRGFYVETAASGDSAVAKCRGQHYDVTLMDIAMPRMDGVATFRRIRKLRPEAPVILMTANSDEEMVQTARSEGVRRVLHKPIRIDQLIDYIEKVVADESGARTEAGC